MGQLVLKEEHRVISGKDASSLPFTETFQIGTSGTARGRHPAACAKRWRAAVPAMAKHQPAMAKHQDAIRDQQNREREINI